MVWGGVREHFVVRPKGGPILAGRAKKIKVGNQGRITPRLHGGNPAHARVRDTRKPLLTAKGWLAFWATARLRVPGKRRLTKHYRLQACNLKLLPASWIFALHIVIEARHIRLRLGKLCAVAFIRIST